MQALDKKSVSFSRLTKAMVAKLGMFYGRGLRVLKDLRNNNFEKEQQ